MDPTDAPMGDANQQSDVALDTIPVFTSKEELLTFLGAKEEFEKIGVMLEATGRTHGHTEGTVGILNTLLLSKPTT